MIQKLLFLSLPILLLIITSAANAQTATDTATDTAGQIRPITNEKLDPAHAIRNIVKTDLRQQIRDHVAAKREEIREAVAAKREEFKTKLQTIKDQQKKALVERIDAKLSNVNAKHTNRFIQVLGNLQIILDKMSADLDKTQAQAAINTAQTAVENQAAKEYAITISTETALRSDVGATVRQLRLDLSATHKIVVDAKQAVQALRKNNSAVKNEGTSSANL